MLNNAIINYTNEYPLGRPPRLPDYVQDYSVLARGRNYDPAVTVPKIVELLRKDASLAINMCLTLRNWSNIELDRGEAVNLSRTLMPLPPSIFGDLVGLPDTRDYEMPQKLKAFIEQIAQAGNLAASRVAPSWSDTAYLMVVNSMMAALQVVTSHEEAPEKYLKKFSKIDQLLESEHGFTLTEFQAFLDGKFNMPRASNPVYPADVRTTAIQVRDQLMAALTQQKKQAAAV